MIITENLLSIDQVTNYSDAVDTFKQFAINHLLKVEKLFSMTIIIEKGKVSVLRGHVNNYNH